MSGRNGCWICQICLRINFQQSRKCAATKCPGFNHHVRGQRQHESNLKKIKSNLENGLPIAAHFARSVGLVCEEEVTRSYGEEGITLALTIDPARIPGAQSFPEDALQPVMMYKADLKGRNKVKGNPTVDARWNKCAKNARTKWRARNNEQTFTCVDRFYRDLGDSTRNDKRLWKEAAREQFEMEEFTLQDAEDFDRICEEADAVKAEGLDDPYRQSRGKLYRVFGHHHVVLASDDFKGTGEQINCCNEFGGIVAKQRAARGKAPRDNTPDPAVREILGPKKDFRFKAPIAE